MSGAEVVILKQNQLMRKFSTANALTETSARDLEDIGVRKSLLFKKMANKGVFCQMDDGRYYMDEQAANMFRNTRRKNVFRAVFSLLLIALAVIIILNL